jgi:hypothetical protein
MQVYTTEHKKIEAVSHKFAEEYGLSRFKPYEIFKCTESQIPQFLEQYENHLNVYYKDDISCIKVYNDEDDQ